MKAPPRLNNIRFQIIDWQLDALIDAAQNGVVYGGGKPPPYGVMIQLSNVNSTVGEGL